MTEGRRIEFVSNVVLGVEGMKGLCSGMLDRLSTNLEEMNKLYEEFQWSEKGSSFEEDDCVKNVLANHEALRTKFNSLEGDFAELFTTNETFQLTLCPKTGSVCYDIHPVRA